MRVEFCRANAKTFDVFASSSGGNLTGTITIDTAAGIITGVDLMFPGVAGGTTLNVQGPADPMFPGINAYTLQAFGPDSSLFNVGITTPNSSLVGYSGGNIYGWTVYALTSCGYCSPLGLGTSGSLTAEVATTPLPAALPLFASVLGAAELLRRRMNRKRAQALV